MQIEVLPEALGQSQEWDLAVAGVLSLCGAWRHYLVGDQDALRVWANARGLVVVDVVEQLLADGLQMESIGPERRSVQVGAETTDWKSPLKLCPPDALNLLTRPLEVWLENGRNDRNFLLAFATYGERQDLEEAETRGWLTFRNAGGTGFLDVLSKQLGAGEGDRLPLAQQHRTMLLMDSDAIELAEGAGGPIVVQPKKARAIRDRLRKAEDVLGLNQGELGSVLTWREAENYAPPAAVLRWAKDTRGTGREQRLTPARGWSRLPVHHRAVLDAKHGAPQPRKQTTTPEVWNTLSQRDQTALSRGFGEDGLATFYRESTGLSDDTGELRAFLAYLQRRL